MKKMTKISIILVLLLLGVSLPASAEDVGSIESNGVTSFFGTYEYPAVPEEKEKEQLIGEKQVDRNGNKVILATGSDYGNGYQVIGFLLLLVGYITIIRGEKNEKISNCNSRYHLSK